MQVTQGCTQGCTQGGQVGTGSCWEVGSIGVLLVWFWVLLVSLLLVVVVVVVDSYVETPCGQRFFDFERQMGQYTIFLIAIVKTQRSLVYLHVCSQQGS